jgi:hypothetical protein
MNVAIEIPDEMSALLQSRWGNITERAREAVAAEAYRSGALTAEQIGKFLGHESRWETEAFLKRVGASLDYGEPDLQHDLAVLRETRGK